MKRTLSILMAVVLMLALFTACQNGGGSTPTPPADTSPTPANDTATPTPDSTPETTEPAAVIEMVIPTYRSGEDAGATFFLPQVERFNAKFEGKYHITIEESPSNTHGDRIKQLALQNALPTVFQMSDSKWVSDTLVAQNMLEDLGPWMDSLPEMKKLFVKEGLDYCTKDGKVIALPITVVKPTGMYYNSTMVNFSKPINEMSWDEFATGLGDTKIGFQTAEGGWTTSLLLAGIIGGIDGGIDMLSKGVDEKIVDFNNPIFEQAFTQLQQLYKTNGWDGAIGAAYPAAATAFYGKQCSVLPDGTWIIDKINDPTDWSNGFEGKDVVGCYYPGNVAIANPAVFDWMMPANLPADQKEIGLAFFEFICSPEEIEAFILAEGGSAPNLTYSAGFTSALADKKLLADFASAANSNTKYVSYFHDAIPASLFTGDFTNYLPKLLKSEWDAKKFCEELTKAAQAA